MLVVPHVYAYLVGVFTLFLVWLILFLVSKRTRTEMWTMSAVVGVVSLISGYFWWTVDWWRPLTLTGTRVGVEDFLIGFASGGIMAVAYEVIFKRHYYRRQRSHHVPGAVTVLLIMSNITAWVFWGLQFSSFDASVVALIATALLMFYYRRDLFFNGVISGLLMAGLSLCFYIPIILFSNGWVEQTYYPSVLGGLLPLGIPIEELVFWFLAGIVWGPLYEYWQGSRLYHRREYML